MLHGTNSLFNSLSGNLVVCMWCYATNGSLVPRNLKHGKPWLKRAIFEKKKSFSIHRTNETDRWSVNLLPLKTNRCHLPSTTWHTQERMTKLLHVNRIGWTIFIWVKVKILQWKMNENLFIRQKRESSIKISNKLSLLTYQVIQLHVPFHSVVVYR